MSLISLGALMVFVLVAASTGLGMARFPVTVSERWPATLTIRREEVQVNLPPGVPALHVSARVGDLVEAGDLLVSIDRNVIAREARAAHSAFETANTRRGCLLSIAERLREDLQQGPAGSGARAVPVFQEEREATIRNAVKLGRLQCEAISKKTDAPVDLIRAAIQSVDIQIARLSELAPRPPAKVSPGPPAIGSGLSRARRSDRPGDLVPLPEALSRPAYVPRRSPLPRPLPPSADGTGDGQSGTDRKIAELRVRRTLLEAALGERLATSADAVSRALEAATAEANDALLRRDRYERMEDAGDILAPVDGRITRMRQLPPGHVSASGEEIGAIVGAAVGMDLDFSVPAGASAPVRRGTEISMEIDGLGPAAGSVTFVVGEVRRAIGRGSDQTALHVRVPRRFFARSGAEELLAQFPGLGERAPAAVTLAVREQAVFERARLALVTALPEFRIPPPWFTRNVLPLRDRLTPSLAETWERRSPAARSEFR